MQCSVLLLYIAVLQLSNSALPRLLALFVPSSVLTAAALAFDHMSEGCKVIRHSIDFQHGQNVALIIIIVVVVLVLKMFIFC